MYEIEREILINKLKEKGITDPDVLSAVNMVERHLFVPEVLRPKAYNDTALPIGYGQTISQPYTVAFMTQMLEIKPGFKVLEIGTGSGYQAAILHKLGVKVYTIERNEKIFQTTLKIFEKLNIRVAAKCGDGTIGWEEFAPYDGILVTAGAPVVSKHLKKQLAVGGKLIIPVGDRKSQSLQVLTKTSDEEFDIKEFPNFAFVPLIGREGWKEG